MKAQDCVHELANYLLGEHWYIASPVNSEQANEIIIEEIKKHYKKMELTPIEQYRSKHRNCKWCSYSKYHNIMTDLGDCDYYTCDLNEKDINFLRKAKFCKYYNIKH